MERRILSVSVILLSYSIKIHNNQSRVVAKHCLPSSIAVCIVIFDGHPVLQPGYLIIRSW